MAAAGKTVEKTSRARLSAVIKSARDIMRKDAGLNGDLDRLPQLSWLLFLRAFDALEADRKSMEDDYRPAIEAPYRWRDWAEDPELYGDALRDFVNGELLPYLKGELEGKAPRDAVLVDLFKDIHNRMLSGYLLGDLIRQLNEINFASSDDIHTMAHLYETILREVRDAAGDSGEFYTPRPVIRFMVRQSFLSLGESILDPACGTGGFLVESLEELGDKATSTEAWTRLQKDLRGIEKKPLPYLLCLMNLILHGIEAPTVVRNNALVQMTGEIGPASKVDVVLTNPPFGGEEETSVSERFAKGVRTKETAWLFLVAILDKLKPGGRCAIVLPHNVLFGEGAGTRIKERLLRECDLHTVVRLPEGVFAPYTQIPANLLFFEKTGPTKETWFYEILPPDGRKKYTKTKPMRDEGFGECVSWWGGRKREGRVENGRAWRVPVADIENRGFNLNLTNPRDGDGLERRSPKEIVADLIASKRDTLILLEKILLDIDASERLFSRISGDGTSRVRISEVLKADRRPIDIDPEKNYRALGLRSFGKGTIRYPPAPGAELSKLRYFTFPQDALVLSNIKAWEGAVGVTAAKDVECVASNRFLFYVPIDSRVNIGFVRYYFLTRAGLAAIGSCSPGMADRNRTLGVKAFEQLFIPLPERDVQDHVVKILDEVTGGLEKTIIADEQATALRVSLLDALFAG
ncbi:N-6 DNA methylase [Planomonospora sp. ID82291]|uniref:N-6 DNA methylase n=1 Tax=Planomonospora sp. ID82291 TaxID=2738136 RepID=UPI0018C3E5F2|nr:N-6 DNA methylase [Planomonospora sp. ID82291]MBG0816011.1 N-6 DNA methylase [Planomonospora sp. ID82291]